VLKLPKDVVSDPRHDAVVSLLAAHASPLWEGGRAPVARVAMTPALAATLRAGLGSSLVVQGLELATEKLSAEQHGLEVARRKTPGAPTSPRVSRLLLVADDGSTRFYRDVDALLAKHADRLLVCRLDLAGEALGEALFGQPKLVRSTLVLDKSLVAKALLALLPGG
jgi:hypothetical protein